MKICTRCFLEKDESEFGYRYRNGVKTNILLNQCRKCMHEYCDKENRRIKDNERRSKNPEKFILQCRKYYELYGKKYNQTVKMKKKEIKQELVNLLGGKCSECGYNKCLSSLDFHHLDPSKKEFSISQALHKKQKTLEEIRGEVVKCIVLCKNCHTELHDKMLNQ